ncbi:hypothetical protein [Hyella patelloides]|uniref:hypothetical protein n=1 Tax=Hyella patelloides TaxID=1982969 RepID=UPI0011A2BBBA|nr:hypothetical protein [Hyella patelloides]
MEVKFNNRCHTPFLNPNSKNGLAINKIKIDSPNPKTKVAVNKSGVTGVSRVVKASVSFIKLVLFFGVSTTCFLDVELPWGITF